MDEININIEETNFCTIVQNDVSDFTVNLENPTTNFCVEVQEGIGVIPHTHPISDIIGLQSELDGLHTDVTNIENALDLKADLVDGKVPSAQLPSYVDDVLEFANFASFPATGESGKIYVALDTNLTYRWSGSTYAEISPSLALGETSSTAYRGDRGKIAYDHSQITSGNPHGTTLDMVTDAGNTTDNIINVRGVSSNYYDVNTTPSLTLLQPGRIIWNSEDGTYDMCLYNDVILQAGQEQHFYGKAVGSIANGSPVQFAGSQGNHFLIKTAIASEINANPELFMGIATQSFTNNQFGYVTMFGNVRDLNTSAYSDGTLLYFDSVNGGLTTTKPSYPNARILVCAVTNSHANQGSLFVRPEVQRYGKWNEIVNQPSTFTPSAHTHAISDVTGLQNALNGKANIIHTHDMSDIIGLISILDGKQDNIAAGTTSQYWRGDKSWQTLDKSAVGLGNVVNLDTSNPSNITQSASYRFVTDTEKATWNAKQNALTNPVTGTGTSGYITKFNGTSTVTNSVIYESSGSVGIGTTSPNFSSTGRTVLDINGSRNTMLCLSVGGTAGSYLYQSSGNLNISNEVNGDIINYTGGSERMRITSSGNVGIGTTSPSEKFQIQGNLRFTGNNITTANTQISEINSYAGSSNQFKSSSIKFLTGSFVDQGNITFNTSISGVDQERVRISENGNVGIGTTSPATKLDVAGAITASGGFFNSDIRLKDITDYEYSVDSIKPISYYWKDKRDDKKHLGYSAQEVQKVMPDAVNEDAEGMLSVNYIEVLVAKIEMLEKRIKQLENGLG